jgi:hypothetical protein
LQPVVGALCPWFGFVLFFNASNAFNSRLVMVQASAASLKV